MVTVRTSQSNRRDGRGFNWKNRDARLNRYVPIVVRPAVSLSTQARHKAA